MFVDQALDGVRTLDTIGKYLERHCISSENIRYVHVSANGFHET